LPGLNSGVAATAVPPHTIDYRIINHTRWQ